MGASRVVYLDHAAATPLDPRVFEAMRPYFLDHWGNPSSLHVWGDAPCDALDAARAQVAALIGSLPKEIYFTCSGTEANNWAVKGLATAARKRGAHVVVSAIEHQSVLNATRPLQRDGFEVTVVPVDRFGQVDPADVAAAVRSDTVLVSVMHANGEVGTVQPLASIVKAVRGANPDVLVHTDAVATAGTIPLSVAELDVDALSLSGSAFYGPKGASALFVREGVRISALMEGGIQEDGRRPGTEDVPAIVGLGAAAQLASAEMTARSASMSPKRERLAAGLTSIDGVTVTGHPEHHLPGVCHVCVEGAEGEAMLLHLDRAGIAAASGSTCASYGGKPSHVLAALGIDPALARGALLFSLGASTTDEDVDAVLETLPQIIAKLRALSSAGRS